MSRRYGYFPKIGGAIGTNKKRILRVPSAFDNNVMGLIPSADLDYKYLYHFLQNTDLTNWASKSSLPSIKKSTVLDANISVPPIEEQKRIVAKLDAVLEKVDSSIGTLEKDIQNINKLIDSAVKGELSVKENEQEHWRICDLKDVTYFQEGPGILAKDFTDSGIPLVRLAGLGESVVTLKKCNYFDKKLVEKKWNHFKLAKGDIIISTSATFGRPSVVDIVAEGAIFYTGIIRFRPIVSGLDEEYLKLFLGSAKFLDQAKKLSTGTTIKHFGPTHLRKMQISFPSRDEQTRIVKKLNYLFDKKINFNRYSRIPNCII